MTTVIDRIEGHYETENMSYGQAYVWCPERVVVECDCGKTSILAASESVCRCGTDYEALVRERLAAREPSDETLHPWDQEFQEWRGKLHEYVRSEELYQRELSAID